MREKESEHHLIPKVYYIYSSRTFDLFNEKEKESFTLTICHCSSLSLMIRIEHAIDVFYQLERLALLKTYRKKQVRQS